MEKTAAFKVQFSGLKPGRHSFEFAVDNTFFEKLESSLIESGEIEVSIELEKRSTMLILDFKLNGWVAESCDRCTAAFHQHIMGEHKVYVKFGETEEELDGDLLVIPRESYQIDVSQLIYEFIGLSIPARKVPCEEIGDHSICDQETLSRLESRASEERQNNPIWDKLKTIKR